MWYISGAKRTEKFHDIGWTTRQRPTEINEKSQGLCLMHFHVVSVPLRKR